MITEDSDLGVALGSAGSPTGSNQIVRAAGPENAKVEVETQP